MFACWVLMALDRAMLRWMTVWLPHPVARATPNAAPAPTIAATTATTRSCPVPMRGRRDRSDVGARREEESMSITPHYGRGRSE
jgi:hypothetical protein